MINSHFIVKCLSTVWLFSPLGQLLTTELLLKLYNNDHLQVMSSKKSQTPFNAYDD